MWARSQGAFVPKSPMSSQHPLSPTSIIHVGDQPSTNDNKVEGKKGRVKFPRKLFLGSHLTYIYPHI